MLKRLYEKSKLLFSILWIVTYCVLLSVADSLSLAVGVEKSVTLPVSFLLSLLLFLFLKRGSLLFEYGICAPRSSFRSVLGYAPLVALLTANLWFGVTVRYSALETVLYIASMLCVGFLEEVIFRGLLFRTMYPDSPRVAVLVSSISFGIGHMINLVNGSGAELFLNLLQVVYATAAGFMFVMLYLKTKSLLPCILTHALFNALSAFSKEAPTPAYALLSCLLLTVISGTYAVYLALSLHSDRKRFCEAKTGTEEKSCDER